MQETWFDPWVGKIPWSRAWHSTPVFLPRKAIDPTKKHSWQSYYVYLGAPQEGIPGRLPGSYSLPTPELLDKQGKPHINRLLPPPSVPLVCSITIKHIISSSLFAGYKVWFRPLGALSANTLIKCFITVLSVFSFKARTQGIEGQRITRSTKRTLARQLYAYTTSCI